MVISCAALKMSTEEIRQAVRNPATNEAIGKNAFLKAFRAELAEGYSRVKGLIAGKFIEHLREGREYAVRAGLRNRFGFIFEGQQVPPQLLIDGNSGTEEVRITFVSPTRKEPIDITSPAPSPYAGQPADPTLPQIEPPRPRTATATGAIVEEPRQQTRRPGWPSYESQVGEQRPSIFDAPKSWMK
jgi:hypothetical protein